MIDHTPSHNSYSHGCRCTGCKREHARYELRQKRFRASAAYQAAWVDPALARARIKKLKEQGVTLYRLAGATSINIDTLRDIREGRRKRITSYDSQAILSVAVKPAFVDATTAREHLRWLQSEGIGVTRIAKVLGIDPSCLRHLRSGRTKATSPERESKILAIGTHLFTRDHYGQLAIKALRPCGGMADTPVLGTGSSE